MHDASPQHGGLPLPAPPPQVLLSDILPTAWHANELGEVGPGDRVAIWGAGPGETPGWWGGASWQEAGGEGHMPPKPACCSRMNGSLSTAEVQRIKPAAAARCPTCTSCAAVGLLAAHCAFVRGAERVVLIDKE